jgi:hypothetical protein
MKNLILLLFVIALTSCASTQTAFDSSPVNSKSVDLDPIKADINIDESSKIKGSSKSTYFLFFRLSGDKVYADVDLGQQKDFTTTIMSLLNPFNWIYNGGEQKTKSAAAYKALSKNNSDVIVDANYTTTITDYFIFKTFKVDVEGYGAKYSNFRTEKQKLMLLQGGQEVLLQDR